MKVNFNVNVLDFYGNEIKDCGRSLNVGEEICKALYFAGNNGKKLNNEEKYLAYKIGRKIAAKEVNYTAEELSFIKNEAGCTMAAGLYGFMCDLIENGK